LAADKLEELSKSKEISELYFKLFTTKECLSEVKSLELDIFGVSSFEGMFKMMNENPSLVPWFKTVETLKIYSVYNTSDPGIYFEFIRNLGALKKIIYRGYKEFDISSFLLQSGKQVNEIRTSLAMGDDKNDEQNIVFEFLKNNATTDLTLYGGQCTPYTLPHIGNVSSLRHLKLLDLCSFDVTNAI
jgi:hypothetical protein